MKIAVNARMLTQKKPGGIGDYAHKTLKRIADRPLSGQTGYPANQRRKIYGASALFVDPFSIEDIAGAMKSICFDATRRGNLIERGIARKILFNWDKAANFLWEAVERSLP